MKKLVIAGFGQPVIDLYQSLKSTFEVLGVIPDYNRSLQFPFFYDFLKEEELDILSFDDAGKLNLDVVLVINYNKIIDISRVNVPHLLNIHMGLLPTYRGNNANSWAILNGDKKVGYTLHAVSSILDGGDIFYKFEYEIQENETYLQAKNAINFDLVSSLPSVLQKIAAGEIVGISQENEPFIYASKLLPEDGIIQNWDCETETIVNLNIIFSRPLGTGLKMKYNDKIIEISKLSKIPNYKISKGFSGAVVLKNEDGSVWIKTKDTAIAIETIVLDNQIVKPAEVFKIGERL